MGLLPMGCEKSRHIVFVKCSHNQPCIVKIMSINLTNPYLPFEHQFVDPQSPISTNLGDFWRALGFEFRIRKKSMPHFTQYLGTQKYYQTYSVHFLTFFGWKYIIHSSLANPSIQVFHALYKYYPIKLLAEYREF